MSKAKDLTNMRFGKLIVLRRVDNTKSGKAQWLCRCDCGNETTVVSNKLISGKTSSCGKCDYIEIVTGDKFGEWTVIGDKTRQNNHEYHLCRCSCGQERYVAHYALMSGKSKSCGCIRDKEVGKRFTKHGGRNTRLYHVWNSMKERCYVPTNHSYKRYGGRGIRICDEWKNDFACFQKWAYENGYDENAKRGDCTIDRIDVNGNYCPENCRWVNSKCQCNNRRSNVHITYNGETHNITEWAKITGINRATISQRYKNGYTNKNLFSKERLNPWNRSSYGRYNTGVM